MGQTADTKTASKPFLRAATASDLCWIRQRLHEAIDSSPHYGPRFKDYEKQRYSKAFLRALLATDPWHLAVAEHKGAPAGLVVTLPDLGTLWSSWIYTFPEFRRSIVGLVMMREALAHFDNGKFHKVCCYAKPDNSAARTLFKRYGFREVALLKRHVLGEDFVLLEYDYNKITDDYDSGVSISKLERLRARVENVLRL
jgi:ribosomal protein S18 acetylase RimI-like enzyme